MDNSPNSKSLVLSDTEYPALQGIKPGATGKLSCDIKVSSVDNGQVTVSLENCDVTTETHADKDLVDMTQQQDNAADNAAGGTEQVGDDF